MAARILNLFFIRKYSFCQNSKKLRAIGVKICRNYCQSSSANVKYLKDGTKLKLDESLSTNDKNEKEIQLPESFSKILNEISESNRISDLDNRVHFQRDPRPSTKNITEEDIHVIEELKQEGRANAFNHSLASYISVCMCSGLYDMGYEAFNYFRNIKPVNSGGLHLLPFNEVLKGIANEGDLERMKEVLISMEESSLKPDFHTLAYCLTCLGRNENARNITDEIENILWLMNQNNITFDKIFSDANFPGDSLHYCLKAIEKVIPDVRDKLGSINPNNEFIFKETCYDNKLLNDLNNSKFTNQVKSPFEEVLPRDKLQEMIQKQIDNERKGFVEIPKINCEISENSEKDLKLWEEWNIEWRISLNEKLDKYYAFMKESISDSDFNHFNYYPYMSVLSKEDVIDVLIHEMRTQLFFANYYNCRMNEMALYFGHRFYNRFLMRYKEKNWNFFRKIYEKYCHSSMYHSDTDTYLSRMKWNKILAEEIQSINLKDAPIEWPYTVKVAIGDMLFKFIVDSVKVWEDKQTPKEGIPGFTVDHRTGRYRTSLLLRKLSRSAIRDVQVFSVDRLPMLSPPVPWTDFNNGGFITMKSKILRSVLFENKQIERIEEAGVKKMYPMMDTLNTLGSVPWKVNSDMLNIITEVFTKGGWPELCICPSPSSLPVAPIISNLMSQEERNQAIKLKDEIKNLVKLWKETESRLSVLNYFKDNSVFWLPSNMDTRGRMYPISDTVTHVNYNDHFRSVLYFAKGKKLGKEGLQWLKLHLVNLTGMMKLSSIEDRLKFCEEVIDEIFDSAKNPLNGNKWWTRSKEPWQTLAACKELVAALESEVPEEFVSHLPIHQDGSCNVLQHFSALGRDKIGAELVNLRPNNTPHDAYSRITDEVEKEREKDARNGNTIAQALEGFVDRKVIKQAVMISIYGAGKFGVQRGILKVQKELHDFPEELKNEALEYLEAKIDDKLKGTFSSSMMIKHWLNKVAKGISKQCYRRVEFETPLGLPVVQNYGLDRISVRRSSEAVSSYESDFSRLPDHGKQIRSFPPNVIQSLEACHLMLTSLFCQQSGVTFISVHDCYWTHAATVPIMNKICREQFIKLYSQPILEDMAEFMIKKCSSLPNYEVNYTTLITDETTPASLADTLKNLPPKGDFDLNEVSESVFFFS